MTPKAGIAPGSPYVCVSFVQVRRTVRRSKVTGRSTIIGPTGKQLCGVQEGC